MPSFNQMTDYLGASSHATPTRSIFLVTLNVLTSFLFPSGYLLLKNRIVISGLPAVDPLVLSVTEMTNYLGPMFIQRLVIHIRLSFPTLNIHLTGVRLAA